jgi:ABC-type lipoprotein release transport system permease subunit
MGQDKDVKSEPSGKWDPTGAAFCGAMIGMTLAIILEAYDIFAGRFDDVDPFIHIATQLAAFAFVGAVLFAAIAGMFNRSGRKSSRTMR